MSLSMRWRTISCLTVGVFASLFQAPSRLHAADGFFDSNGVKIHYTVEGEGEPVLLIHGFAINASTQWVLPGVAKALAKDYRVIALDNRGHGQSGKPHDPKQYGIEMVEDAVRLLDHLQIKKAHVIGYSMGGLITLKLAAIHPERVLSATLGGMGLFRTAREPMLKELADSLENGNGFRPLVIWLNPPSRPKPTDSQVEFVNKFLMGANDVKAMAALVRGSIDPNLDITDEQLKAMQVPMLAIVGDLDPFKAGVDELKKQIMRLQVVVVPAGDHFSAVFKPVFLESLQTFLAAHRAERDPR